MTNDATNKPIVVTLADGHALRCTPREFDDAMRWRLTDDAGGEHVGPIYGGIRSEEDIRRALRGWWDAKTELEKPYYSTDASEVSELSKLDEKGPVTPRRCDYPPEPGTELAERSAKFDELVIWEHAVTGQLDKPRAKLESFFLKELRSSEDAS
jgi:hypothetical protein